LNLINITYVDNHFGLISLHPVHALLELLLLADDGLHVVDGPVAALAGVLLGASDLLEGFV
jgi:hypothetical protein